MALWIATYSRCDVSSSWFSLASQTYFLILTCKRLKFFHNCGESPLAVRQWEYSWILSRFFLQVYSFTNLALTCTPKYCMVKKIWQTSHDWYDIHCVLQLTLKLCYVSFFIASDILNAIGTGNSGARKLVKVIFEQRKKPLKKQTGRRVRVTQGM